MTGSMVDLFAGYNWRIGNFVVGGQLEGSVFSDVSLKTIGVSTSTTSIVATTVTGAVTTTSTTAFSEMESVDRNDQLRSNFGAIARVGYLVTPDVLVYGLGGLALGHFVYPDSRDNFGGKNGKWVAGYTAGAGGEVKLTDNWSLRAEYRYLHLDVKRDETVPSSAPRWLEPAPSHPAPPRKRRVGQRPISISARSAWSTGSARVRRRRWPPCRSRRRGRNAVTIGRGLLFRCLFRLGRRTANGSFTETSTLLDAQHLGQTSILTSSRTGVGDLAGDMTGSTVELFAGHNWRFGSFVVGGQVEGTVFSDVSLKTIGTRSSVGASTQATIIGGVTTTTSRRAQAWRLRNSTINCDRTSG